MCNRCSYRTQATSASVGRLADSSHCLFLDVAPVEGEAVCFQRADKRREALPRGRGVVEECTSAFLVGIVIFESVGQRSNRNDAVLKAEGELRNMRRFHEKKGHIRRRVHFSHGLVLRRDYRDAMGFLRYEAREHLPELSCSLPEDEELDGEFEETGEYCLQEGASVLLGHPGGEAEHGTLFLHGPSEFLLESELVAQFSLEALCAVRRDNCGVGGGGMVQRRHLPIIEEKEGCSLGLCVISFSSMAII